MSKDTIYREDVIKALTIAVDEHTDIFEAVERISSADRLQGEWELSAFQSEEDVANGNYAFICSNCEHTDIHALTQRVPYCWWCGARMKGTDNENEMF